MRVVYKEIEFHDGTIVEIKNRRAKPDEWYELNGLYYDYAHIDETKKIDWMHFPPEDLFRYKKIYGERADALEIGELDIDLLMLNKLDSVSGFNEFVRKQSVCHLTKITQHDFFDNKENLYFISTDKGEHFFIENTDGIEGLALLYDKPKNRIDALNERGVALPYEEYSYMNKLPSNSLVEVGKLNFQALQNSMGTNYMAEYFYDNLISKNMDDCLHEQLFITCANEKWFLSNDKNEHIELSIEDLKNQSNFTESLKQEMKKRDISILYRDSIPFELDDFVEESQPVDIEMFLSEFVEFYDVPKPHLKAKEERQNDKDMMDCLSYLKNKSSDEQVDKPDDEMSVESKNKKKRSSFRR
ncbi:hypothetical protein MADA3029_740090 [Vibrio nigripulchritudo MADA3029]|uniref:hypothetical protein n=1 Tax=Vibrio nigripulchritudo TaxID=28173 RepID=UPI0003B22936|nr:hypothetical protein [Vibrio nigripulchritudo]CCN49185.1 hypothetical protein VIBNIMADA3020_710024 [Vibrio nigripulchritudo MADA3020]CCN54169.1 hypothetical protein VIBNIMADA3021_510092 [Vibrio nigripulchritudo MADA3021]CCN61239.1 hypothetical protein MADA3029_740090 [Vibrio nigripulchritudo MADA3029]